MVAKNFGCSNSIRTNKNKIHTFGSTWRIIYYICNDLQPHFYMKVNTKIRYGLRLLIVVANKPEGILQKDFAKEQGISVKYLDSIIPMLKLKGLLINVNGKGSGYKLAKSASEITLYDIYTAFEPISVVNCVSNPETCQKSKNCKAFTYWCELKIEISEILKRKTLVEII